MEDITDLMTPIFALYNFDSLNQIMFKKDDSEYLKDMFDLKERASLYNTLQWAANMPEYDFKSIIKNAPIINQSKFSNEEIYSFLMAFKKFMENEEYDLLTDNRATNMPWDKTNI